MPLSGLGAGRDRGVNPEVTGEPAIPVGLGKHCWFTAIATTIYSVYEGTRVGSIQCLSARPLRCLRYQRTSVPDGKSWTQTDQFIAVLLIQSPGLEGVGEVDGLRAPARGRLGFGGGDEPGRQATPAQTRRHPQALQFAAVAPGPPADAGDDPASRRGRRSPGRLRRRVPWRRTPHGGSAFRGRRCRPDRDGPRRGTLRRPTRQAPAICSISDMSSKYVRKDRIFPSRKSATVTPGNTTCRPVASSTLSSLSTSGPV